MLQHHAVKTKAAFVRPTELIMSVIFAVCFFFHTLVYIRVLNFFPGLACLTHSIRHVYLPVSK